MGRLMNVVKIGSGLASRNRLNMRNDPVAVEASASSGENLQYFDTGPQRSMDAIANSAGQVLVNESSSAYGVCLDSMTWAGPASSTDRAVSAASRGTGIPPSGPSASR